MRAQLFHSEAEAKQHIEVWRKAVKADMAATKAAASKRAAEATRLKEAHASSLNKRNHCLPNKRNRNETWGGLRHMRRAARRR